MRWSWNERLFAGNFAGIFPHLWWGAGVCGGGRRACGAFVFAADEKAVKGGKRVRIEMGLFVKGGALHCYKAYAVS